MEFPGDWAGVDCLDLWFQESWKEGGRERRRERESEGEFSQFGMYA